MCNTFSASSAWCCMLQGEKDTEQLNSRLAAFTENALKFTMDGGMSAYEYKQEEEEKKEKVNLGALIGMWAPDLFLQRARQCCIDCARDNAKNVTR